MLERPLLDHEVDLVRRAEALVRDSHRYEGGHDHAHVLAVTDNTIRIAEQTDEIADPLVVTMGALFHDLGRIGQQSGVLHGLRGAAVAREWLQSTWVDGDTAERILRVIARHTPTTGVPPEAVEERIVYDADALDRLGIIGMLRGLTGKHGSTEHIIEDRIQKRLGDYGRLHFDVSRRMGEDLHAETLVVVQRFREALKEEVRQINRMVWPIADDFQVAVPSLSELVPADGGSDLTAALARVEPEVAPEAPDGDEASERPRGFARCLTRREADLLEDVADFVRVNHADLRAHDYAHVLTVVKNALRIARGANASVDPLVLICGALLHDIGWVGSISGVEHGLRGASLANEYLSSTWLPEEKRDRIRRVVVRHSFSSGHPPEAPEERIVWDADGLAGLGIIGVARGVISGVGSMGEIIEACLRYAGKRAENLYFDESRRIAEALQADSRSLIRSFLSALKERKARLESLRLPA